MTAATIATLLGALGAGGAIQALVGAVFNRRVTDADATVKIVAASGSFTETVLERLAAVEAKVSRLEIENSMLKAQIFALGHTPLQIPEE